MLLPLILPHKLLHVHSLTLALLKGCKQMLWFQVLSSHILCTKQSHNSRENSFRFSDFLHYIFIICNRITAIIISIQLINNICTNLIVSSFLCHHARHPSIHPTFHLELWQLQLQMNCSQIVLGCWDQIPMCLQINFVQWWENAWKWWSQHLFYHMKKVRHHSSLFLLLHAFLLSKWVPNIAQLRIGTNDHEADKIELCQPRKLPNCCILCK